VTRKRDAQFREWLEKTKDEAFARDAIKYDLSPDEITWAKNRYNRAVGLPPER
jgi:hypothetical protein